MFDGRTTVHLCRYGTYAIGDATVRVLGSRFDVGSYETIIAGPAAVVNSGHFGFMASARAP